MIRRNIAERSFRVGFFGFLIGGAALLGCATSESDAGVRGAVESACTESITIEGRQEFLFNAKGPLAQAKGIATWSLLPSPLYKHYGLQALGFDAQGRLVAKGQLSMNVEAMAALGSEPPAAEVDALFGEAHMAAVDPQAALWSTAEQRALWAELSAPIAEGSSCLIAPAALPSPLTAKVSLHVGSAQGQAASTCIEEHKAAIEQGIAAVFGHTKQGFSGAAKLNAVRQFYQKLADLNCCQGVNFYGRTPECTCAARFPDRPRLRIYEKTLPSDLTDFVCEPCPSCTSWDGSRCAPQAGCTPPPRVACDPCACPRLAYEGEHGCRGDSNSSCESSSPRPASCDSQRLPGSTPGQGPRVFAHDVVLHEDWNPYPSSPHYTWSTYLRASIPAGTPIYFASFDSTPTCEGYGGLSKSWPRGGTLLSFSRQGFEERIELYAYSEPRNCGSCTKGDCAGEAQGHLYWFRPANAPP